tara:strand:+ start:5454 stop:6110 length:657 start_codon:yes stop_codon:yes gene_type:complete
MLYANKLYIVSSLGRSGSSLLYETITESNLKKDKNNYFWKTHYNAKEIMNTAITNKKQIKNIFIFRDPVEIILSLLNIYKDNRKEYGLEGKKFIHSHCQNMRRNWGGPVSEIVNRFDKLIVKSDILQLENMFDSFIENNRYGTLMVNYNSLWENKTEVEGYLQTKLKLPNRVDKDKTNKFEEIVNEKEYQQIKDTYKELSEKINNNKNIRLIKTNEPD